jgi:DNA-directed RNA polymerase subunit RPC12/RpoP
MYTCAKCGQRTNRILSLDHHGYLAGHRAYSCAVCSDSFQRSWTLGSHCTTTGHDGWACAIESCTFTARSISSVEEHQRCTHIDLLKSQWALEYSCHQCGGEFSTRNDLTRHATDSQHNAFLCEHPGCVSTFTRYPDLIRHEGIHAPDSSRYPCHLCKRHRGPTAFKRKDHLTQHLRNYHHVDPEDGKSLGFSCPKEGCENYRDETFFRRGIASGWKHVPRWNTAKGEAPFPNQAALTKHLKAEHDESQFPCEVPFCDRVRGKGFTRKRDLFKHRQAKHPEYQGGSTSS